MVGDGVGRTCCNMRAGCTLLLISYPTVCNSLDKKLWMASGTHFDPPTKIGPSEPPLNELHVLERDCVILITYHLSLLLITFLLLLFFNFTALRVRDYPPGTHYYCPPPPAYKGQHCCPPHPTPSRMHTRAKHYCLPFACAGANMAMEVYQSTGDAVVRFSNSLVMSPDLGQLFCCSLGMTDLQSTTSRPVLMAAAKAGPVYSSCSRHLFKLSALKTLLHGPNSFRPDVEVQVCEVCVCGGGAGDRTQVEVQVGGFYWGEGGQGARP